MRSIFRKAVSSGDVFSRYIKHWNRRRASIRGQLDKSAESLPLGFLVALLNNTQAKNYLQRLLSNTFQIMNISSKSLWAILE